jgi:hypothetical protein
MVLLRRDTHSPFDDFIEEGEEKVCAVMAAETDRRIFVQQGCFTVHTNSTSLEAVVNASQFLDRLVIPAANIKAISEELLLCGFRKSTIFPDLTNLSEDLEARYL